VELVDVKAASLHRETLGFYRCSGHVGTGHLSGHTVNLSYQDDLGSERFEHPRALRAISRGHSDNKGMPQRCTCDGEAGTHVAAGHLNDWGSQRQTPVFTRSEQDGAGRSVFDTSSGLHKFGLGQNAAGPTVHTVKSDQGSMANQIEG
jgi:hypothetical protein